MQQLIDFIPLAAFVAGYLGGGIYVATGALIAGCLLQIALHWWRAREIKTLHWVTALLALVLGAATFLFHDPHFIQMKLSALMWLLGISFLVSQFIGAKPLSRRLLEGVLAGRTQPVSERAWSRLNLAWVAFFTVVGFANYYVVTHFSEQTWFYFKVIGVNLLLLLFMIPQLVWLMAKDAAGQVESGKGP